MIKSCVFNTWRFHLTNTCIINSQGYRLITITTRYNKKATGYHLDFKNYGLITILMVVLLKTTL